MSDRYVPSMETWRKDEMFWDGVRGSEIFSESQCISILWEVSIIKLSFFDVLAEDVT